MRVVTIEAVVQAYEANARFEDFGGEGAAVQDATALNVASPEAYAGTELTVFHTLPPAEDSPWRRVGRRVQIDIDENALTSADEIFDGSVTRIEIA